MRWQNDSRVSGPAVRILEGKGMSLQDGAGATAYRPPLYIMWLSGNYAIFGVHALIGPSLLQALVSTLNVGLLFLLTRRLWKRESAALAASALLAIHPYTVWHDAALYHTFLSTALLLGGFTLLFKGWDEARTRPFFWSGILFGLGLLVLGVAAPFVLLLIIAACITNRTELRRRLPWIAAFILGLTLTWGPWIIRNAIVFHAFVPLTTESGVTLWMGNNPEAGVRMPLRLHEISPVPPGTRFNIPWYYEYCRYTPGVCANGISEAQETRELTALAMGWIRAHPFEFIRLTAWRFVGIWSPFLTPSKTVLPVPWLNTLVLWSYAAWTLLLYVLMGIGLWGAWRLGRRWETVAIALLALSATGFYALFLYFTKYRIPFEAVLLVFAGGGVMTIVNWWKSRRV